VLEADLSALRPYSRIEFRDAVGEGMPGVEQSVFDKYIFDHQRAPFIERRGIDAGVGIVRGVPADSYPVPDLFLAACLCRVESFAYEQIRYAKPDEEQYENRTVMFRVGIRKVIRTLGSKFPDDIKAVWSFRRRILDLLEEDLLKGFLGCEMRLVRGNGGDQVLMADLLHSVSPAELLEFSDVESFKDWFESGGGAFAKKLTGIVAGRGGE